MGLLLAHLAGLGYGVAAREDNAATRDVGCCAEVTLLRVEAPATAGAGAARWGRAAAWGGRGGGAWARR
jgi:hypothetical protein